MLQTKLPCCYLISFVGTFVLMVPLGWDKACVLLVTRVGGNRLYEFLKLQKIKVQTAAGILEKVIAVVCEVPKTD